MKRSIILAVAVAVLVISIIGLTGYFSARSGLAQATAQDEIKMPEVIILAKDAKLGQVTFNHVKHNGGTYNIDKTSPIACISCHHTAQPASEVIKHPPLKTAWPADRTTVLTVELFTKDPKSAGVAACRDCHSRAAEKPKLLPAIPEIKHEGSTALVPMTNQNAFHRNCAGCHTEVRKTFPASKGPITTQCVMCHKKAA